MEGMSRSMEQIRTEQPRSIVDHPVAPSAMSPGSIGSSMDRGRMMRAIEHPCRLKDHASYIHDHHFGRPHEHGCRSTEHVSRLLDHRQHEAQLPGRPVEHPAVRPPMNYSCRSLDHAPGRPMPMDCVIFGPHTHPPPRLPAESPFRINCPVHSPFRFRFPNGTGTEYHSHSQVKRIRVSATCRLLSEWDEGDTIVRFFLLEDCTIYSTYLNGSIDVDIIICRISTCGFIMNKNDDRSNNNTVLLKYRSKKNLVHQNNYVGHSNWLLESLIFCIVINA